MSVSGSSSTARVPRPASDVSVSRPCHRSASVRARKIPRPVPLPGGWGWARARGGPPSAKALEASLLAPCCFGGTLDVHDSEISRELRDEIEARVARGESTLAIESDLVSRYGPQIRAMPDAGAFSATMAVVMFALGAAGVAVLLLVRRWRQGDRAPTTEVTAAPRVRDAEDDQLDAELEALDA